MSLHPGRLSRHLLPCLWVLSLLLPSAAATAAGGFAVEGIDRARMLVPSGVKVEDYQNAGYRLRVLEGEVHIEVEASPLTSKFPFSLPVEKESGNIPRLAHAIAAGASTRYEAVSRVLGWVSRHIEYDLDRDQAQSADEVLLRRSGYCTGVARLTVSLLEAIEIPAREVAGYVLEDGAGGYHRWIEVLLPDRGWVFSDPMRSHHYVPASYVRLAGDRVPDPAEVPGLLLERFNGLRTVDLYPSAVPGVRARRNHDQQLAATLQVEVESVEGGMAVLEGRSQRRTHALIEGVTTFVGLEPGSYQLRLIFPQRPAVERSIELNGRIRKALFLPAESVGG